jgi:hypothetical protein
LSTAKYAEAVERGEVAGFDLGAALISTVVLAMMLILLFFFRS